jgi:phage baseplate assembly protein V
VSAEIERLLANMIRVGVVSELDEANARVKMKVGGLTTDWLPWGESRAGATRTWSAPRPGEQRLVFAPYGDTSQAVIGPAIFQDDHPAPAASKDQEHVVFPDGSAVDYNSATGTLTVTVAGDGKVIVNCKEATINAVTSVTLNTPLTHCTQALTVDGLITGHGGAAIDGGNVTVTGANVVADGIGLKTHHHTAQGATAPTTAAQA